MNDSNITNFNQNNIKAIDNFLSDNVKDSEYLQKTYKMVQTGTNKPVKITKDSRKNCVKSFLR